METLEAVYHRLHTSEIPVRLPCREAEFERICTFIKECIGRDAVSQAMYVSGVPGTGKTATVLQVTNFFFQLYSLNTLQAGITEISSF